ncbi:MAG: DEAD/DEAH box helicase [Euryhalocaulis sp.]|uniref:DEAD/DEAH box helicase n=1 Tax=Euryhalocaulis sp. TaxID=2744307 RepID=UPI00180AC222|nr:DEAD/DEAH box helicase [Euryhalocaulis sp.]MBA4800371.1 DEAD/DEAH box helicase [Euryhalocaulis sp.]
MTFDELGLGEKLLSALKEAGYTEPTPIQAQAIPPALEGRDVLGIAQTGTGKTAAFTLPMIERLSKGRARARMPRSLVLAPTRELAAQVAENFKAYSKNTKLTMALLIGGVAFGEQERVLNSGADVIIATPGRLLDLFERGKVMPAGVEIMVVDEADRMLDMGFIPDVERIFKLTPFTRQTLFFSATMPKEIQHLVDQFLQGAVRVEVAKAATTADNVAQYLIKLNSREPKAKRAALREAIDKRNVKNAIVFCNRKRDVDTVARSLQRHGYSAAPIHGDLPQSQRMKTLDQFRSGELKLLVGSDVAARGLDIPEVSHVLNYDPPHSSDDYVHRIGRTGRAGKSGEAITIATSEDSKRLASIEQMLGGPIPALDSAGAVDQGGKAAEKGESETEKPAKPKRSSRGGARKADAAASKGDQAEKPAGTKKPEAEKAPAEKSEKSGGASKKSAQSKTPRKRENTRSSSGGKSQSGSKGEGFGDHVPAFFEQSVRQHISAS